MKVLILTGVVQHEIELGREIEVADGTTMKNVAVTVKDDGQVQIDRVVKPAWPISLVNMSISFGDGR